MGNNSSEIFKKAQAEYNDKISIEAMRKDLEKMFQKYDKDNSKFL